MIMSHMRLLKIYFPHTLKWLVDRFLSADTYFFFLLL